MLNSFSAETESGHRGGITPLSSEDRENIESMRSRGISDSNIASILGINQSTVAITGVQAKSLSVKVIKRAPEAKPEVPWIHPSSVGDENWETEGLCRNGGYDPDLWFPHPTDITVRNLAQRVCYRCPVIMECRTTALIRGEKNGIWGGLTETQRKKMRKRERDKASEQYLQEAVGE